MAVAVSVRVQGMAVRRGLAGALHSAPAPAAAADSRSERSARWVKPARRAWVTPQPGAKDRIAHPSARPYTGPSKMWLIVFLTFLPVNTNGAPARISAPV